MRFKVLFPFRSDTQGEVAAIEGLVKDISMAGIKIVLNKSLRFLANNLEIFYFHLPDKILKVSGRLIWQREFEDRREAGVKFIYISDYDKKDIYEYIYQHHRQELTQKWWQM